MTEKTEEQKAARQIRDVEGTVTCSWVYSILVAVAMMAAAGIILTFTSFDVLESAPGLSDPFTGDSDGYYLTAFICALFAAVSLGAAYVLLMYMVVSYTTYRKGLSGYVSSSSLRSVYIASFVFTVVSFLAIAVSAALLAGKKWSVGEVGAVDSAYSTIQFSLAVIHGGLTLFSVVPHYFFIYKYYLSAKKYGLFGQAPPSTKSKSESATKSPRSNGFSKLQ